MSGKNIKKEKTRKTETYEMVVKHVRRSALVGLLASAVVVLIAVWSVVAPYAVVVDGETVCYVKNKEDVGKMTQAVIEEYLPDNATDNNPSHILRQPMCPIQEERQNEPYISARKRQRPDLQ